MVSLSRNLLKPKMSTKCKLDTDTDGKAGSGGIGEAQSYVVLVHPGFFVRCHFFNIVH